MALSDEVQARYSAQALIDLTNPDNSAATTVDSTRLGYACTDVQADFTFEAGVVFDLTNSAHVDVAVEGVIAKLKERNLPGASSTKEAVEAYLKRLKQMALIGARNRITPQTDSTLVPSTPTAGALPPFDPQHIKGFVSGDSSKSTWQE